MIDPDDTKNKRKQAAYETLRECRNCHGAGKTYPRHATTAVKVTCPVCRGLGWVL